MVVAFLVGLARALLTSPSSPGWPSPISWVIAASAAIALVAFLDDVRDCLFS